MRFSRQKATTEGWSEGLSEARLEVWRSRAVPGEPGATKSWHRRGDWLSYQVRACSRPPPPTTRTLTLEVEGVEEALGVGGRRRPRRRWSGAAATGVRAAAAAGTARSGKLPHGARERVCAAAALAATERRCAVAPALSPEAAWRVRCMVVVARGRQGFVGAKRVRDRSAARARVCSLQASLAVQVGVDEDTGEGKSRGFLRVV